MLLLGMSIAWNSCIWVFAKSARIYSTTSLNSHRHRNQFIEKLFWAHVLEISSTNKWSFGFVRKQIYVKLNKVMNFLWRLRSLSPCASLDYLILNGQMYVDETLLGRTLCNLSFRGGNKTYLLHYAGSPHKAKWATMYLLRLHFSLKSPSSVFNYPVWCLWEVPSLYSSKVWWPLNMCDILL